MNFDQLKAGDSIYQALITVEGGYVFEKKVVSVKNTGYIRIILNDGGYIMCANAKSTENKQSDGCYLFTDEKQAVRWVDTQLKKQVRDAEKLVKTKIYERKQFQRKFNKYFTDENI